MPESLGIRRSPDKWMPSDSRVGICPTRNHPFPALAILQRSNHPDSIGPSGLDKAGKMAAGQALTPPAGRERAG